MYTFSFSILPSELVPGTSRPEGSFHRMQATSRGVPGERLPGMYVAERKEVSPRLRVRRAVWVADSTMSCNVRLTSSGASSDSYNFILSLFCKMTQTDFFALLGDPCSVVGRI